MKCQWAALGSQCHTRSYSEVLLRRPAAPHSKKPQDTTTQTSTLWEYFAYYTAHRTMQPAELQKKQNKTKEKQWGGRKREVDGWGRECVLVFLAVAHKKQVHKWGRVQSVIAGGTQGPSVGLLHGSISLINQLLLGSRKQRRLKALYVINMISHLKKPDYKNHIFLKSLSSVFPVKGSFEVFRGIACRVTWLKITVFF